MPMIIGVEIGCFRCGAAARHHRGNLPAEMFNSLVDCLLREHAAWCAGPLVTVGLTAGPGRGWNQNLT